MRTVSDWASVAPATRVGAMFEISDNTVRRYDQKILESDMPAADLDNLRAILIDEKAVRKGHNYVTVVTQRRHRRTSSTWLRVAR